MNDELDSLTKPYLHKAINDCTVQDIKNITETYPFFAPAQFALLKKLKQEDVAEYEQQTQKAVLYYYDPLQFEAFVNSGKFITDFDFETAETDIQPETIEEENQAPEPESNTVKSEEFLPETEPILSAPIELAQPVLLPQPENKEVPEQKIIPPASQPVVAAPDNTSVTFEPYYTVDYFASQGIKLSRDEAAKDQFGKQLKSFTEWLKTMKRLPMPELSQNIDPSSENKVVHMAAHSIENTDIVTETMAEVWLKQGNMQKAIEVYNKLSLQNPSKKAYFAAKIDNLKKAP